MAELWYQLTHLPDLTLNKYASLEGGGVDDVLEKHIAFLRQLNRKGIVSDVSFHLFYLYLAPEDAAKDAPGRRLRIFLLARGAEADLKNVPGQIAASPLADFFKLEPCFKNAAGAKIEASIANVIAENGLEYPTFDSCAILTKSETLLPSADDGEPYYLLREWEMNEDGRLYSMCKMMEALNRTALYRVDLYPVERSEALRDALWTPMSILRRRQEERGYAGRDHEAKDVLDNYEELLKKYESSPHFIANVMVFANGKENAVSLLDAAGSESLVKGKYCIAAFQSRFDPLSFLDGEFAGQENVREKVTVKKGKKGLIVCNSDWANRKLNYLPTLFSLEEIAPFFRLPALYDGEVIQTPKETTPPPVDREGALFLGSDRNGYDVYYPLSLLPKHAFFSGVPGSGKTNTMLHVTSSLWKQHRIPFLVLEPAKQEYRALLNDPEMSGMYLFSPNADMSFPLHINPFEMPKGTLVAEHIRRLCSVFEGAFPLEPPMPFLLDTAIEAVYRENGWIPEYVCTGEETLPLPTMSMLYRRLEEELKSTRYSDEVRGNLESALKVRIGSLLRREMGEVFDVPQSTFYPEKWLEVPAVIELESMGAGPANFLTLLLCSLIRETLKVNPRFDGPVRHVIFIEEAHNLIGPESDEQTGEGANPKIAATAFVVKMLAEVRALKEGIVIADQLPTVMAQEVLKNTGLKIGLRLTAEDDRALLGGTMAASPLQLEQMATFEVGGALIFYEGLLRPFQMRMKEWQGEIEDKEQKKALVTPKNDADLRAALAGNEAYQDENVRSIRIISRKFTDVFAGRQSDIQSVENSLDAFMKLLDEIEQLNSELNEDALKKHNGQPSMSDEKLMKKYDALVKLKNDRDMKLAEEGNWRTGKEELIDELNEQALAYQRLRAGRWARFGASQDVDGEAAQLEITLFKTTCDLGALYIRAYERGTQSDAAGKSAQV